MAAPVAPTEIVNLALDIIKTQTIEDVEDPGGDPIAVVMNRWWDLSRRKCLEGFPWVFARKRIAIPLEASSPAFGEYSDAYKLPNDYISLNWLIDEVQPKDQFNYTIESDRLLINNSGGASLNIGYTWDTSEVPRWSANFKLYVAHQLAAYTVFKLTGNVTISKAVQALLQPAMIEAKAINGLIDPPKAYRSSKMLNARLKNSDSSAYYIK